MLSDLPPQPALMALPNTRLAAHYKKSLCVSEKMAIDKEKYYSSLKPAKNIENI